MARRLAPEPSTERGRAAGPQGRRPHAAPRRRPGRGRRARPGRRVRPGTGWCSSAARSGWPTRCWATAPTSTSRSRPLLRERVVRRLRAAVGRGSGRVSAPPAQRQGPGRAAAHAGALPARPRRGPASTRPPRRSASTRTSSFSDLKVLFMCGLPGRLPRRPDRRRHRRARGTRRRRTDGVIRVSNADYLARPLRLSPTEASAVIVALRALRNGAKDDTREVVDRALAKLEAAAAEGRRRAAADRPGRRRRRHRPGAARQPAAERRGPRPAGAAELLRARAATSSPSGWSTRAGS